MATSRIPANGRIVSLQLYFKFVIQYRIKIILLVRLITYRFRLYTRDNESIYYDTFLPFLSYLAIFARYLNITQNASHSLLTILLDGLERNQC